MREPTLTDGQESEQKHHLIREPTLVLDRQPEKMEKAEREPPCHLSMEHRLRDATLPDLKDSARTKRRIDIRRITPRSPSPSPSPCRVEKDWLATSQSRLSLRLNGFSGVKSRSNSALVRSELANLWIHSFIVTK